MNRRVFAFLVLVVAARAADLIPAANVIPWVPGTDVGIIGGIPTNRTNLRNVVTEFSADNTGATNTASAIQAAINASAEEDIIYLPNGTYRIDSALNFDITKKNRTLRGQSQAGTILDVRGAVGVNLGSSNYFGTPTGNTFSNIIITAGMSKGSDTVTLTSTDGFVAGELIAFLVDYDPAVPTLHDYGYPRQTQQLARLTSKTSTTLTFFPPLYKDYGNSSTVTVRVQNVQNNAYGEGVGIETLTIDGTNGASLQSAIYAQNMIKIWIKGVRIKKADNYPVQFFQVLQSEIRDNWFDELKLEAGTNRSGFLCNAVSATLVENNIFYRQQPLIEINFGSSGNVFSRNFFKNTVVFGVDTNHGPHPHHNLFEANWGESTGGGVWMADGYFGSASEDTFFRNVIPYVSLKRFTRNYAAVLNFVGQQFELGRPNLGNSDYTGTANFPSDPWADFGVGGQGYLTGTLTTRTDDNSGVITFDTTIGQIAGNYEGLHVYWSGNETGHHDMKVSNINGLVVTFGAWAGNPGDPLPSQGTALKIYTGNNGYQELDQGVEATLTKKGNRYQDDNSFDDLGGASEVDSLIYGATKPQWLLDEETALSTTFVLKAFDPVTPTAPSGSDIPAGYRYLFTIPPEQTAASINSAGTQLALTINKPVTAGAGGNGGLTVTGSVTATYASTTGSTLYFNLSRTVANGETLTCTYTQPGNGFEDANGVDLPSFSSLSITNNSQQESGASWVQLLNIEDATGTVAASNPLARKQAVTFSGAGWITKLRIGVGANPFLEAAKIALLDTDNSTVLRSATLTATTVANDYQVFSIDSYHVPSAGTYYIAFTSNGNGDLLQKTISSASASTYSFTNNYSTWPGATAPTDGTDNYRFSMGALFAPDSDPTPGHRVGRLRFMMRR